MRLKLDRPRIALCCLISALLPNAMAVAQVTSVQANAKNIAVDESLLTIDRIFADKDFDEERLGQLTWSKNASYYYTFKPKSGEPTDRKAKSRDLVRIACESGIANSQRQLASKHPGASACAVRKPQARAAGRF